MEESDIALMARIKDGDMRAFEALLERHKRSVYNLARRFLGNEEDADDVAQEAFIRVYRAAGTYTPQAKFTTWLYTIVKNLCFNVIRKRTQAEIVSLDDEEFPEIPAKLPTPFDALATKEVSVRVSAAVHALPENLRMAVILKKYYGLSYDEIASVFGCTVNAVKLRVHRAKEMLAQELLDISGETK